MELGLCLEDPLDHAEREIGVVLGDDREAGVVLELARERAIIGLGPGLKETKQPLLLLTGPERASTASSWPPDQPKVID